MGAHADTCTLTNNRLWGRGEDRELVERWGHTHTHTHTNTLSTHTHTHTHTKHTLSTHTLSTH